MVKKIIIVTMLTFFLTFNFNIQTEALEIETFKTTFSPVQEFTVDPDDPSDTSLHTTGSNAMLISACITITPDSPTFIVEMLDTTFPAFGVVYESINGFKSEVRYYQDNNCGIQTTFPTTSADSFFKENNGENQFTGKTYLFNIPTFLQVTPAGPNNPVFVENVEHRSLKVVIATSVPASSIIPVYLVSSGSTAPAFNLTQVNNRVSLSFDLPNVANFFNGDVLVKQIFFLNRALFQPTVTKTDHFFAGFVDINGKIFERTIVIEGTHPIINKEVNFFATFERDLSLDGTEGIIFTPPPINNPLDIILLNTGFYNPSGFTFLFTIAIIAVNVLLFVYKFPGFTNLLASIFITGLFMFLGYLPVFVIVIMILLFVILIINYTKGGLTSE